MRAPFEASCFCAKKLNFCHSFSSTRFFGSSCPTYLPTYPTFLPPTYLPTQPSCLLPTYLPTTQPSHLPTYLPIYLPYASTKRYRSVQGQAYYYAEAPVLWGRLLIRAAILRSALQRGEWELGHLTGAELAADSWDSCTGMRAVKHLVAGRGGARRDMGECQRWHC